MTEMVLSMPNDRIPGEQQGADRMQVMVHVEAEVLTPNLARRRANIWLSMNAGHLLSVKNPELLLGEALQWRFDVYLSIPQQNHPGLTTENRLGQIRLNAITGEVVEPDNLIEELIANADTLAAH